MATNDPADTKRDSWARVLLAAAQEISLSRSYYEKIDSRYKSLKTVLDASDNPLLAGAYIFVQGSVGLKTTIKPSQNATSPDLTTVDADAVILLPNAQNASAKEVLDAIKERFAEGSRTTAPVEELRRGIRIVYSDDTPGFHIDITPAISAPGNINEEGYGNLKVPDRELQAWKCSTPRDYSKWLEDTAAKEIKITFGTEWRQRVSMAAFDEAIQDPLPDYDEYLSGRVLQAVIKLLKRHRDEWAIRNSAQSKFRPISAVITTLATHAYSRIEQHSSASPLKPLDAILGIIDSMPDFIEYNLSERAFKVLNPLDRGENFAEKWNRPNGEGQNYQKAFYSWHASVKEDFRLGLQELGESIYKEKVRASFGLSEASVDRAERTLPGNWILPGRQGNVTMNAELSALAFGFASSGQGEEQDITPPGRLG